LAVGAEVFRAFGCGFAYRQANHCSLACLSAKALVAGVSGRFRGGGRDAGGKVK